MFIIIFVKVLSWLCCPPIEDQWTEIEGPPSAAWADDEVMLLADESAIVTGGY